MEDATKKKPVKVFICGPVKAAVWANSKIVNDTLVEVHSTRIDRAYKDDDTWAHTNSFHAEDLPKVSVVAMEAYKFIRLRSPERNEDAANESDSN
jgi:hypothetical protein